MKITEKDLIGQIEGYPIENSGENALLSSTAG